VITNPIIEVDETAGTASCRSYYTVIQQTDDLPLQVIVAGRYHDQFLLVDGRWRYA
jgi:SnoaL-like domain